MITLTDNQMLWLRQRGGRLPEDVQEDECGLFVFMGGAEGEDVKVYLPEI